MHAAPVVEFRATRLSNGLEIQAEVDPAAHTAAVGFFVRTGARDEPSRLMGVSHFLEHMMFKGSERRTAEEVNRGFDELGANHNAFTTTELTAYHAHVLPDRVGGALDILADILRPAIRSKDFDEEKGVILEEIAMYADQPFWVGYEALMERLYTGHPLSHRVLGTAATVSALGRDEMQAYFDARYAPDNAVLVAAGAIDFDRLVADAERLCGSWKPSRPSRDHPVWTPGHAHDVVPLANSARTYLMLGMASPHILDPRRYAAGILMHVLGGGDGSRLHWALIETGLAEEASASYEGHDGTGESVLLAVCDPDKAERIESVLRDELAKLVDSLEEDDLLRARSRIATGAAVAAERPNGRMFRLGTLWGYSSDHSTLDEEVERISRVTLRDLRECCEAFPLEPTVAVRVVPVDA